jgi:hypothetical protein
MEHFSSEFQFDQLFTCELAPLDLDFTVNNPLFGYTVPTININGSNSMPSPSTSWQPPSSVHLSPIQTDVPGNASPAFSTPSQASDSSHEFRSPPQIDPLTPSPISSPYEFQYSIRSPESTAGHFDPESPDASSLGLSVGFFSFWRTTHELT